LIRKPSHCGEVLLPYAAILSLHFLGLVITTPTPIDETPKFQKIVCAKRGSAGRDLLEGVLRRQISHVAQKRLKLAGLVVIEDPILTPSELPRHQFVLGATKRMKGMGYSEPAWGVSQTTCIR
jgi:hypothetical protein